MPEIENTGGSMKTSDEMGQSGVSESMNNNGKRARERKESYVLGLIIVFVAVYSQYLFQYWGVHLGLIFGSLLVYGIPTLAITLLWGTSIIRKFFKNTLSALKLGLGLFGAFTVLGTVLGVVILIFLIVLDPSTPQLLEKPNPVLQVTPIFAWIMVGVSFLVTGPAEEYIFRGFMFGGLLDIFKNRHWLILAFVSSLLFSATHLYYALVYGPASLVQFADLITFGMAMASTYYLSGGNLSAPALIHGAYDATAFIGVATSTVVGDGLRAFMILLGIIVAFLLYIQRGSRRNQIPSNVPRDNTRDSSSWAERTRSKTEPADDFSR